MLTPKRWLQLLEQIHARRAARFAADLSPDPPEPLEDGKEKAAEEEEPEPMEKEAPEEEESEPMEEEAPELEKEEKDADFAMRGGGARRRSTRPPK